MEVLLVDDHPLIQDGIKLILERHYAPVIMHSAYDYSQALELIESNTDFDLVLFDLRLPDVQCFEGLRHILSYLENTPVIVLSASEDPKDMREALAIGAHGYIPKSSSNDAIASAIQLALTGARYIPFAALDTGNTTQDQTTTGRHSAENIGQSKLSKRQIEVLGLVIKGKTNKEIGRTLFISDTTARAHITAIFKALKVTNRTQACYVATQLGLWPR